MDPNAPQNQPQQPQAAPPQPQQPQVFQPQQPQPQPVSQPYTPQPQAPATYGAPAGQPYPAQAPASAQNPGKTLGIVSLVLAIVGFGLIGLIVGIIGLRKSKKAGFGNPLALTGIILSIVSMIVGVIIGIAAVAGIQSAAKNCAELGPGTHQVGNTTYTCS